MVVVLIVAAAVAVIGSSIIKSITPSVDRRADQKEGRSASNAYLHVLTLRHRRIAYLMIIAAGIVLIMFITDDLRDS